LTRVWIYNLYLPLRDVDDAMAMRSGGGILTREFTMMARCLLLLLAAALHAVAAAAHPKHLVMVVIDDLCERCAARSRCAWLALPARRLSPWPSARCGPR
jgi:hypothetical protein